MDTNGMKVGLKIADELSFENKGQKNKKIIKSKDSTIIDNSKATNINEQNINNTTINVQLSDVQIANVLGIASNEIFLELKENLKLYSEDLLKQAAKEVHPLFLATHLNQKNLREQELIFTDISSDASIKKQALQRISVLTRKDLDLLLLLKDMETFSDFLSWNFQRNYFDFVEFKLNEISSAATIDQIFTHIKLELSRLENKLSDFKKTHGEIKYSTFENLLNNNIVKNDENTNSPLKELFCKLFIDFLDDELKKQEYYNDKERITKNREKWTQHFTINKYNDNIEITNLWNRIAKIIDSLPYSVIFNKNKNLDGNFFWFLTSIGKYIAETIKDAK